MTDKSQESNDHAQEVLDKAVAESGTDIPGEEEHKREMGTGDRLQRKLDKAVQESGTDIPGVDKPRA